MGQRCAIIICLIALCAACGDTRTQPIDHSTPMSPEEAMTDAAPPLDTSEASERDGDHDDALSPEDSSADAHSGPTPRSVCGQPSYTWLPSADMGQIVAEDPRPLYTMPKELVTALLQDSGFIDILDLQYDVEVIGLRYTSQDRGVAVETTALIGLPVPPDGESVEATTMAFLAGTSGFSEACAGSLSEGNALAAILYAAQGFIAVLPDYLGKAGFGGDDGIAHPYVVSEAAAIATWDGVRAAHRLIGERGDALDHDGRVILWGGSQGGHAVYAADRFAPYYAPEFDIVGAVATVAPSDLTGQAPIALQELGAGAVGLLASCITLADWHGMWDRIGEVVRDDEEFPVASWLKEQMQTVCFPDLEELGIQTIDQAFRSEFLAAVQSGTWEGYEDWRCVFDENSLRHQSLPRLNDTPFLTVLASEDVLVDLEVEYASHQALCEAGYDLTMIQCKHANHTDGTTWSVREQFAWVKARLAGEDLVDTCAPVTPTCCLESPSDRCVPPE